ncbi:acyl-CoA dehydrogenase [Steroidobacter cummioxidans]|uniref:acyl-CoA dehydrogenase n=2 Tax=Steroidobacter cummioxidans TaxID=1803913 RepID=UPI000E31CF1D|nr:acyl-CoA dehydrogenase [Steroidobacter cummioxidans]
MSSLLLSRRDVDFLLFDWLDVTRLTERPVFADHSRQTFDAALDTYSQIAHAEFAPHNKKVDREPPKLVGDTVVSAPEQRSALQAFAAAGLLAACQEETFGGMRLPYVVERAGLAFVLAACPTTAAYAFLTIANANLLLTHGTASQKWRLVRPMLDGRWTGTMCLSEPHAGSSLADITSRAERQSDGSYRLTGNKMWISGGDHDLADNIVHLVLAKVPDERGALRPGVAGISLFAVPKYLPGIDNQLGERNDVVVAGLNHKMGYRGTSNCLLNFGEGRHRPGGRAGAVGELIGEEGRGLAYMFHMMNEARITVGLGAAAIGYTGYLHSVDYARSRRQGRLPTQRNPETTPVRLIDHADVRRMLLAQKAYVEGALALVLFSALLVDETNTASAEEAQRARQLLDLLTPVSKSWPSKWGLAANDLAIQVHGGYGYTQDFNVEQFYRDNRLNPIHEGTFGIQAIDLLGRKVSSADGAALAALTARIERTVERAASAPELAEQAIALRDAWSRVLATTTHLRNVPDATLRLANASCYLDAFGHVVVAWLWLDQAVIAIRGIEGQQAAFYRGKLAACRYFYKWELPRIDRWLGLLDSLDRTTLDMADEWFD